MVHIDVGPQECVGDKNSPYVTEESGVSHWYSHKYSGNSLYPLPITSSKEVIRW